MQIKSLISCKNYCCFLVYCFSLTSLWAFDIRGSVEVYKKRGNKRLKDASNAIVYISGIKTIPPPDPAKSEQIGKTFEPRLLPVVEGQKVQFWNQDKVQHNVFCKDRKKSFDFDRYEKGLYREEIFEVPGFYKVYCNIHQQMICDVIVLENSYFSVTNGAGDFHIKDIPPGKYTIHVWHIYGGKVSQELNLDKDVKIDLSIRSTRVSRQIFKHKNKYGKSYSKPVENY